MMNACEVVATTGSPAFAVDRHGIILAWNDAAKESLGYRCREALRRSCYELLQGEDFFGNRYCDERCPLRSRALLGGPINPTQMSFRTAAGGKQPIRLSVLVVPGGASIDKAIVHLLQCLPPGAGTNREWQPAPTKRAYDGNSRLTPREIEVLTHLGDGKGTQEIAELLCISSSTVRHHIQNSLNKMKVHGRLQAVALGRKLGLI